MDRLPIIPGSLVGILKDTAFVMSFSRPKDAVTRHVDGPALLPDDTALVVYQPVGHTEAYLVWGHEGVPLCGWLPVSQLRVWA